MIVPVTKPEKTSVTEQESKLWDGHGTASVTAEECPANGKMNKKGRTIFHHISDLTVNNKSNYGNISSRSGVSNHREGTNIREGTSQWERGKRMIKNSYTKWRKKHPPQLDKNHPYR